MELDRPERKRIEIKWDCGNSVWNAPYAGSRNRQKSINIDLNGSAQTFGKSFGMTITAFKIYGCHAMEPLLGFACKLTAKFQIKSNRKFFTQKRQITKF